MAYDIREEAFIEQRFLFVERASRALGIENVDGVSDVSARPPIPVAPVLVENFARIRSDEADALAAAYWGTEGVAHFIVLNAQEGGSGSHPLLAMAEQLAGRMPLNFPVTHPMEGHAEAVSRFGPADGTLKIYDLETGKKHAGYREQAETSEQFDAHNDGLGYAGAVAAFALYADSGPLWGGYTYFQNIVRLSLLLAKSDPDAFAALFLPDALTALRPRGKGAIRVTTPVLFLNELGEPQTFFRVSTGEYRMDWRCGVPALVRAARFLEESARPFAPGSTFVNLSRRGAGCFARNGWLVHGRTAFLDGERASERRVLARKWFMTKAEHAHYKHVPGMHILAEFAEIYPERFGPAMVQGDWNYDPDLDANVRNG